MDTSALLAQATFFQGLAPQSRKALAAVCRLRELRKRELLFREGARGEGIFLLASGHIQLHKTTPAGEEIVIKIIKPGESFAEAVLFEADRYPVTALALSACRLYVVLRQDIENLLGHSDFRRDFITMLMRKQRYLTERIRQLSTQDVAERLLVFLREQYGPRDQVQTAISKKDIAAAIGVTPETLSRLIPRLKKEMKIVWSGRMIRFPTGFWQIRTGKTPGPQIRL
jgi:CRP/FNR family transcriptional regulator